MGSVCSSDEIISGTEQSSNKVSTFTNINENLELISQIGNSVFGKVRLFRDKENHNQYYAIKTIKKAKIGKEEFNRTKKQIDKISSLSHPNIVKYYGAFEDGGFLNIVMEYLQGDNLYKLILSKEYDELTEKELSLIVRQVLRAMSFLKANNIVHRHIKPENIVFYQKNNLSELKLIDFGFAIVVSKEDENQKKAVVGTKLYMAPETFEGYYSEKSDVWSLGVVLFFMLTGKFPYNDDKDGDVEYNIKKKNIDFSILNEECSPEAKDLVMKMLEKDKNKRISVDDIGKHPWFKCSLERGKNKKTNKNKHRLQDFAKKNQLEKEIFDYVIKIIKEEMMNKLSIICGEYDFNNTGMISQNDIASALQKFEPNIREKEIKTILDGLYFNENKMINYNDNLESLISIQNFGDESKMWSCFCYLTGTTNKEDVIKAETIINKIKKLGINYDADTIKRTFNEYSKSGKELNFREFKDLMKTHNY